LGTRSKKAQKGAHGMKPHIGFEKIWFDEDIIEIRIEVCDGESLFVNSNRSIQE
jgi:hypothetical protein